MKPVLTCRDIKVDFDGFYALKGVNLNVFHEEVRFLIGPNGAGKTTLLDVICGKTRATNGQVIFEGSGQIDKMQEHKIASAGIARKFQAPSIFPKLTVFENLELSVKQKKSVWALLTAKLNSEVKAKIDYILEKINLQNERNREAGELAHGQKQWLEIGMQLIQEPNLLLLDEPIAGMSGVEREKTGYLIHDIAKECSVLVVEHDMDFVRNFSKQVTVMHEGAVLCEGSMAEVQENEQVVEVYLGRGKKVC
ncbi:urea ABC transporter ATP-binding protein UrtD [Peribacillus asahii]|uniref:Urea ABC transporter ATP-binding protein UrtD n=1 Tax=Peribacillus asahii TaxID=228899 RepID=A0A398B8D8_9BACI|nr:urea ABC transporter ATP-binding protein UrtD [Peribacillus asahii]RID86132.1 urea ABC transporter ATP-binding protein UrtD [Peribacillus asahii]